MFVGGMDPLREETFPDTDNYPEIADMSAVQTFRDRAHHRFPVMRRSVFRGDYSGLYDMTPDLHPVVDHLPGADGLFVTSGYSGYGYKYGPAIACRMGPRRRAIY